MINEKRVIEEIENNLAFIKNNAKNVRPQNLDAKWKNLIVEESRRLINNDFKIKVDILRNFRKLCVFIPDTPEFDVNFFNLRSHLSGGRRGAKKLLQETFNVIKQNNFLDLLRKYPSNKVGNPNQFKYKGYVFTYRWLKHIYSLGILRNVLKDKLKSNFVTLDIGSSYGIFSYLLKKEFPDCKCVLLDFPEQLIMAHYYLGLSFPEAKIANYKEIYNLESIDRSFLEKFDFILIPWFLYEKITAKSIDLVTNFASFGEMKREWFDCYVKKEPFLNAKYFFTANRFQSAPTYDTDLTILDYPLHDFKKLHFGISPIFTHTYVRKMLFFYEKLIFSSQYFEFIGER